MDTPKMQRKLGSRVRFLLLLVVVGGLSLFCSRFASTPDGSYYDKYFGTIGPTYFVFEDGKAYLKPPEGLPEFLGFYSKVDGKWITDGDPGQGQYILKPGIFGIEFIDPANPSMNRFLPRRGFVWLNQLSDRLMPRTPPPK